LQKTATWFLGTKVVAEGFGMIVAVFMLLTEAVIGLIKGTLGADGGNILVIVVSGFAPLISFIALFMLIKKLNLPIQNVAGVGAVMRGTKGIGYNVKREFTRAGVRGAMNTVKSKFGKQSRKGNKIDDQTQGAPPSQVGGIHEAAIHNARRNDAIENDYNSNLNYDANVSGKSSSNQGNYGTNTQQNRSSSINPMRPESDKDFAMREQGIISKIESGKGNINPTEKQLDYAKQLGIEGAENMTNRELANANAKASIAKGEENLKNGDLSYKKYVKNKLGITDKIGDQSLGNYAKDRLGEIKEQGVGEYAKEKAKQTGERVSERAQKVADYFNPVKRVQQITTDFKDKQGDSKNPFKAAKNAVSAGVQNLTPEFIKRGASQFAADFKANQGTSINPFKAVGSLKDAGLSAIPIVPLGKNKRQRITTKIQSAKNDFANFQSERNKEQSFISGNKATINKNTDAVITAEKTYREKVETEKLQQDYDEKLLDPQQVRIERKMQEKGIKPMSKEAKLTEATLTHDAVREKTQSRSDNLDDENPVAPSEAITSAVKHEQLDDKLKVAESDRRKAEMKVFGTEGYKERHPKIAEKETALKTDYDIFLEMKEQERLEEEERERQFKELNHW
jgi:hypothetical protein